MSRLAAAAAGSTAARPLRFTFDGRAYRGFAGDTLASALLANGVHLVGRSFKYHRPRGIMTAGAEEPNALIQLERPGGRSDPNLRATEIELYDGLTAASQNRWPSLGFDVGAVNDLLSPLLAGRLLLQDLPVAGRLVDVGLRAVHPPRRRPRPRADAARPRPLPAPPRPLRRAGGRRRPGRADGGAGRRPQRRAGDPGRARARARRLAARRERHARRLRRPARRRWLRGRGRAATRCPRSPPARAPPPSAISTTTISALLERVADHLPPPPRRPAAPAPLAGAREAGRAGDRRHRAAAGLPRQRPARRHAGQRRAHLPQPLRRAPGRARRRCSPTTTAPTPPPSISPRAGVAIAAIVDSAPATDGALPRAAAAPACRSAAASAVVGTGGRLRVDRVWVSPLRADGSRGAGRAARPCAATACSMSGGWNPTVHLFSQSRGKLRFDDDAGRVRAGPVGASPSARPAPPTAASPWPPASPRAPRPGPRPPRAAGFSADRAAPPAVREPEQAPLLPTWAVPSRVPARAPRPSSTSRTT